MSEKHLHESDKDQLIKQAEEAFESAKERGWVGLTDEEVEAIYDQEGRADVVLLTQAKLKEKNNG
jgi:hypothetical protein